MISFYIGRWNFELLNFDGIFCWHGKRCGYEGLWDEYSFGFLLALSYDTDYQLELAEEPCTTPEK